MKGKIDRHGQLWIERAGKLKIQGCPNQEDSYCGDWCPLFGESKVSRWMGSPNPDAEDRESDHRHWDLEICKKTILFDELVIDK